MYETQVQELSPEEAKRLYDQGVPFFDVREVEEYAQARIPGARLLPLSEFMARHGRSPRTPPWSSTAARATAPGRRRPGLAPRGTGCTTSRAASSAGTGRGFPWTPPPWRWATPPRPLGRWGHEAAKLLREALVVDVREAWEYGEGHLPGAVNIPLSTLPQRLSELPKDRPILLVCNSGNRSGVAAEFLVAQGFDGERVYNLEGGTYAWMGAGLPVER